MKRLLFLPSSRRSLRRILPLLGCAVFALSSTSATLPAAAEPNPLLQELGRNESRVYSAPFAIPLGVKVKDLALEQRLEQLGYERVQTRPEVPGTYFWGHDVFWIFRPACRVDGKDHKARLFGLVLNRDDGLIVGTRDHRAHTVAPKHLWIEPLLLAESLDGRRAVRRPTRLDRLPDHVWKAVLAAEDGRFFDHVGVDSRSVARALLANFKAGKIEQGGSTITQQLIKNRDLSPKRSVGRKASEALRALALEATYSKRHILEAYLDQVYLGHLDGLAVHGLATAAQGYFGKAPEALDLAQAALLAAMIQGPNRLSPQRNPGAAAERRNWVIDRMVELDWVDIDAADAARAKQPRLRRKPLEKPDGLPALPWIRETVARALPDRVEQGRGVVAWSSLDPYLQQVAEKESELWMRELKKTHKRLRKAPLSMALVSVDASTGDVLAVVGGDPQKGGEFDRSRKARRQPGSTLKPLLLLEAFERCGRRDPVYPARRIVDEPLTLELPSGPWSPKNSDGEHRGVVDVRRALRESLNVPFVRLAEWCGRSAMADRLQEVGLAMPDAPPPSFALGALEVSPLELARAYTVVAGEGVLREPSPIFRLERPSGRRAARIKTESRRVVDAATAFLVHDLMLDVARDGTAQGAQLDGVAVAAKTGTSSERRDAWLVGYAGSVVTVVWIGRDDGKPLKLTGAQAAAPLWRTFMDVAARAYPTPPRQRPKGVVTRTYDPRNGLLVGRFNSKARPEIYRKDALPPRKRIWRSDPAIDVIR